jgi:hypothetical protein
MGYVEILRARRTILIYSIIVGALAVLAITGVLSSPKHGITIDHGHSGSTDVIPLSFLVIGAGFIATIIASILGASLNRERPNLALTWTKPVSRERFALTYIGVDAIGILSAFAIVLAAALFVLWAIGAGGFVAVDRDVMSDLLLCLGIAFAYYGVLQALSAAAARGGAAVGISWPVAFALVLVASVQLPAVLHQAIIALNFLNPIAYLTSVGKGTAESILPVTLQVRIALVWLLAVASCAVAVVIWKRLED